MDKPTPLSCAQQGRYAVAALFFANGFFDGLLGSANSRPFAAISNI